jgi:hypothetical protein
MRQPRGIVWTERALVFLIMASLAGTVNLVTSVHRKAATRQAGDTPGSLPPPPPPPPAPMADTPPPVPGRSTSPPAKMAAKPRPPAPAQSPEDPTKKALSALAQSTAREVDAAHQADRRAESLEKARQTAVAESERWRRREMLVKQQVAALADRARKIDRDIDTLAAERDVLARERDALKAAVARDQGKGSNAVLPYKGANGTWRRPIVLECTNGTVTLRPKGPTFTMLDLSSMINPRSSPVILAIARELLRVQMSESPDGAPVVPYFVFLVRPDGIRPYYEARGRLEPLGIAFGYELIEQDLKVDVPDFDNVATWDGTIPLEEPLLSSPGGGSGGADTGDGLAWPSTRPSATSSATDENGAGNGGIAGRAGDERGTGGGAGDADSPDQFVWPTRPQARGTGRPASSGTSRSNGSGLPGGLARGPLPGSPGPGTGQGERDGTGGDPGPAAGGTGRRGFTGFGPGGAGDPVDRGKSGSGAGSGPGTAGDPPPERWPFPNQGEGNGAGGGSFDGQAGPGARPPGTWALPGGGPAPRAGTGSGAWPDGSLGPDNSPAGRGLPKLPDLEPAGDGAKGAGDPAGSNSPGGARAGEGPRRSGSLAGGQSAKTPTTGLEGTPGGVALHGAGLEGLPQANPPQGLGDHFAESGAAASEPISPGRLRAMGDLLEALPPGSIPRSATGLGSSSSSVPASSDVPPPTGLGSPPPGSSSAASGASTGTTELSLGSSSSSSASGSKPPSGASGLMVGSDAGTSSSSSSDKNTNSFEGPRFTSRIKDGPTKTIDVPFQIVVVCEPEGVIIHPGGYRITGHSLQARRADNLLAKELLAVAQQRAATDPSIRPIPRVKFLVESGGTETFWAARKQILFSGLSWPMSLEVTGAQDPHLLGKETW